jgi:hypothetical protein
MTAPKIDMASMCANKSARLRDATRYVIAMETVEKFFPQYLVAHACFECRKSFKIAPRPGRSAVCPNCASEIHEMGRSFKMAPARDAEQWAKVQALYDAGFRFSGYRSKSGPPLPDRLAQVPAFLKDNPAHPLRVAALRNAR